MLGKNFRQKRAVLQVVRYRFEGVNARGMNEVKRRPQDLCNANRSVGGFALDVRP